MHPTDVLHLPRTPDRDAASLETVDGGSGRRPAGVEIPDRVGRYVVLEKVGRGGMGIVFAAYDPELDRKVAVKLIDPLREDLAARVRLLREAQAMAKLQHPNVVAVHDVGTFEDRVFVAMEFVSGCTLGEHLSARELPWRDALAVLVAAGRGLAAAHAVGLVHRDFKPDNVLVSGDGRVRVGDFGLARALDGADTDEAAVPPGALGATAALHVTQTGMLLGTPAYMAPEQHARRDTDARTDQFAFCVAAYEALFHQRPFAGDTAPEIAAAVLAGDLRPLPRTIGMPLAIGRALARGLSTDPAQRWPDMDALLAVLERAPARARRRWIAAGGSLAIVGSAIAAVVWVGDRDRPCERSRDLLAGVWDSERRSEVEQAVVALSPSTDAWPRLETRLDAHAAVWIDARVHACEVHERREVSDELFDRTVACLGERRSELDALVRVLAEPDADALQRSIVAAAELAAPELCEETAQTRSRFDQPDEAISLRVAMLREQLEAARVVAETGRLAAALADVERITAEAVELGYSPLVAEARLREAWVRDRAGQYDAALEGLQGAWYEALAAGHDEVAARAAADLVLVLGVRKARIDEGVSWARNAEALLERCGDDPALAARYHANVGNLYGKRGDHAAAIRELRTAVELETAHAGADRPAVARQRSALGLALQRAGQYDDARVELEHALAIQEAAFGPAHPEVATTLNNLGALESRRGRFEDARVAHERALAIRLATLGATHPDTASSHTNLGAALRHLERWDEAAEHLREAIAIKTSTLGANDPQVADAITNLGNVHFARGDLVAAQEAYARALDVYTAAFGPEHPDVGAALNNLGVVQWKRGELERANETLTRALGLWERVLGPKHPDLAAALLGLGEVALARGRVDEATAWLERASALLLATNPESELLENVRSALARAKRLDATKPSR